jgi:stage V sporulation protein AD
MGRMGRRTFVYENRPAIKGWASVAGPKEGQGPLGHTFDAVSEDDLWGQKSWEQGEREMLRQCVETCVQKGGMALDSVQAVLCGDLLNQIITSSFAARALGAPFLGLYGACSTMIEALLIGGALVDGGYLANAVCAASSHFSTAERQYRFPLEMGCQRPPSAQWTVTAAGSMLLDGKDKRSEAVLTHGTMGRVVDYQITDANHMGAAMAPAVADTLQFHLSDTGRTMQDYDLIATGDLGHIGRELLMELLARRGIAVDAGRLIDCGDSIFSKRQSDVNAGGSGCGCVASVLCGWLMRRMKDGELSRMLLIGSGALLSTTSSQQGESIPGIAHAVVIERRARDAVVAD